MKISIIGTGYVGLCTGVGLAIKGHEVTAVDVVREKVDSINSGKPPIYEPGLEKALKTVIARKKFTATTDLAGAVRETEISFISVGTPSRNDGSIDLAYVKKASEELGKALKNKGYHVVVVKSTVVPGTTEELGKIIEKASGRKAGEFGLAMNPEFLREGKALADFESPDRIVIGALDRKSADSVRRVYSGFSCPILETDIRTAEMIKYASNVMLASRVSLSNDIGNICKSLGIDTYNVMEGVGLDHRISKHFLRAGSGYGGSCFPKDINAIISRARELGYDPRMIREINDLNERQKVRIVELLEKRTKIKGKTVSLLGLAFKPDSDDIRESPAISIIKTLNKKGAKVKAYDPQATKNMKALFPEIEYASSAKEAIRDSDACLLITEWDEFRSLTDSDFSSMRGNTIIEGRKILDMKKVKNFEGLCW